MLKQSIGAVMLVSSVAFTGPVWSSFDASLVEGYNELFADVQGAGAAKALHLMPPAVLIDKVNAGDPVTVLDLRTPAETAVYGFALPGSLAIPVNELFTQENLARIPADRPVVLVCSSGARAIAAGTALRHLGLGNVYILKGGLAALAGYLGPGQANTAP